MTLTSLKQTFCQFKSHLLGHWLGPTQSLKPAWILGSAHGHVHKAGEKKERTVLSEDKNQGICPTASTRKNAEARKNWAFRA
jgi:hypothetical protein